MDLPIHLDYEGQKLAEKLFQGITLLFGTIGWLFGYYVQEFLMTILIVGLGFILACLVTLPPWPIYRRHPLRWASVQEGSGEGSSGTSKKRRK